MDKYILQMKGITKTFPGVKALDNVIVEILSGEIHGLIGENGGRKKYFDESTYGNLQS